MATEHHTHDCACGQRWMLHFEASKAKICDVLKCHCGREIMSWGGYFEYIAEPLPRNWKPDAPR